MRRSRKADSLAPAALLAALTLRLVACEARPTAGTAATEKTAAREPRAPEPRAAEVAAGTAASGASSGRAPSFEYVESWSAGAARGSHVPLILALHGLGDSPPGFAELFRGFPCPARILLPHSDVHYGGGFSWFPFHPEDPNLAAPDIARRADALFEFVLAEARASGAAGRPIVTGFSQGGALSFALAARHGDALGGVFPIGGWLPDAVTETASGKDAAPLVAFHGAADPLITVDRPRAAVARLAGHGFRAELVEFPGVRHSISSEERAAYFERLSASCAREATRP